MRKTPKRPLVSNDFRYREKWEYVGFGHDLILEQYIDLLFTIVVLSGGLSILLCSILLWTLAHDGTNLDQSWGNSRWVPYFSGWKPACPYFIPQFFRFCTFADACGPTSLLLQTLSRTPRFRRSVEIGLMGSEWGLSSWRPTCFGRCEVTIKVVLPSNTSHSCFCIFSITNINQIQENTTVWHYISAQKWCLQFPKRVA